MLSVIGSLVVLLLKVFFGIIIGIFSIYLSLKFFDKMTGEIDEIKEIKKGNVAVAIILVSVILSIAGIVSKGINSFDEAFSVYQTLPMFIISFIVAIAQLVVVIAVAIISIYISVKVLYTMTAGINETNELKKGNVAVGLIIGGVVYVIAFAASKGVEGMSELEIFNPILWANYLGVL